MRDSLENEQRLEKESKVKALFIDDNKGLMESLSRAFSGNENIVFIECHNVKEALEAIKKYKPSIVFLDNSLSEEGNEGLEIADKIKGEGIKIYSTTLTDSVVPEYNKRGIERIGKTDLSKIRSIVTESAENKDTEK